MNTHSNCRCPLKSAKHSSLRAGKALLIGLVALSMLQTPSRAGEELLGYVKGAETLPEGAWEFYTDIISRFDKGAGDYTAFNYALEAEYGVTDSFQAMVALKFQTIDTSGLLVDAYIPGDKNSTGLSGFEIGGKYNFLKPAISPIGLSASFSLDYDSTDPHSGQDKDTLSADFGLQLQKYYLDGQLVWIGNTGLEATSAKRDAIANLPDGFEWPTDPEMEIELKAGTGLSYRIINNLYIGAEALYETEFETEVGQERWSVFAGPSIHYASSKWWATLTWLPQLSGGGEMFDEQDDDGLHLIEKTKQEIRLKVALNF